MDLRIKNFFLKKDKFHFWEKFNVYGYFIPLLMRALNEVSWMIPCPPKNISKMRLDTNDWSNELEQWLKELHQQKIETYVLTTAFYFPHKTSPDLINKSRKFYELSALESQQGNCLNSRKFYLQARQNEIFEIVNNVKEINQKTKSLNSRFNIIPVDELLIDKEDFVDPIHPSILGHEKITRLLIEHLQKI
jgi:hypothetical protein